MIVLADFSSWMYLEIFLKFLQSNAAIICTVPRPIFLI